MSTVILVSKKSTPEQLSDLRLVALSSLVINTLEKIVKSLILSAAEPILDPLQFAYRAKRGVEDAKLFLLDKLYMHRFTYNIYVPLKYSSASHAQYQSSAPKFKRIWIVGWRKCLEL